jgi:hypothetical protein
MTEAELVKLLRANPELQIAGDVGAMNHADSCIISPCSEFELQRAIVTECQIRSIASPAYGSLVAIPNGQYRRGQRMEPGLAAGMPDLALFVARHGKHGLFIELKVGTNKQSEDQLWWQRRLRIEGYLCECIWDDAQQAMNLIEWYLER